MAAGDVVPKAGVALSGAIKFPREQRMTLETGAHVSLWWVTRGEWEGLIEVAGLEVEALFGWFDRVPFGDESEEFVWVARKPG